MAASVLLPARFIWVYLGLFGFIWVYLYLFAPQTLSAFKPIFLTRTEASRTAMGAAPPQPQTLLASSCQDLLKFSSFAVCVLLNSDKPSPAPLQVCAAQRDGWHHKSTAQTGIIQG